MARPGPRAQPPSLVLPILPPRMGRRGGAVGGAGRGAEAVLRCLPRKVIGSTQKSTIGGSSPLVSIRVSLGGSGKAVLAPHGLSAWGLVGSSLCPSHLPQRSRASERSEWIYRSHRNGFAPRPDQKCPPLRLYTEGVFSVGGRLGETPSFMLPHGWAERLQPALGGIDTFAACHCEVAQLAEQAAVNGRVGGSSPPFAAWSSSSWQDAGI